MRAIVSPPTGAQDEPVPGVSSPSGPTLPLRYATVRPKRLWLGNIWMVGAILTLAFYLITLNVATPWQAMHEDNGTLNESIAANHLRYGLSVTRGQDLLDVEARQSFGPQNISEAAHFAYFLHGPTHPRAYGDHPPLLGLTIAGSFLLFGPHFWSERLVPIAYTLAGLLLFLHLAWRFFDRTVALVGATLYATTPMFAYFGRNVAHEAPVLCWMLLALTGYLHWRATGRGRYLALVAIGVVLAGLYGWPAYYFAPLLWAIDWRAERRPSGALFRAAVLPAILTGAVVMAQLAWVLDGDLARLGAIFLTRTSGGGEHGTMTTTIGWFTQIAAWNAEGFGGWSQIVLPFSVGFVAIRSGEDRTLRVRTIVVLAAWGISHILVFRDGAFVHAYWQFYLLPAFALSFAWTAVMAARHVITRPSGRRLAMITALAVIIALQFPTILSLYSTGFHTTLQVTPLFDLWR